MAILTLTIDGISKNGAAYSAPGTPLTICINDTLGIKFSLKNTSKDTIRRVSAVYEWVSDTGEIIGSKYVMGTRRTGNADGGEGAIIFNNKTLVFEYGGIYPSDMGMSATDHASKIIVRIAAWKQIDDSSPSATAYYTIENVTYQGEAHYPTITGFEVRRNGNETPQLVMSYSGTRQIPAGSVISDSVSLDVSINSGEWQSISEISPLDVITVDQLLSGTTDRTMSLQIPTTSTADFRLTFGNEYESKSVAYCSLGAAFANIHLAGYSTGGVALGRFSSSTQGSPKFECEYPAYFSNGVFDADGEPVGAGPACGVVDSRSFANGYTLVDISFGKTLKSVPVVVAIPASGDEASTVSRYIGIDVISTTTTGCKLRISNSGSGARVCAINWVAIC